MQTAGEEPAVCGFLSSGRETKTQGESSHKTDAKRKFVTTQYLEGEDGELASVVPERCISHEEDGECRIQRHDWRERLEGPSHRLRVVRCVTHRVYFTLYPPGYTPWGRRPIAADDDRKTLFTAAREAASGTLWARHDSRQQHGDQRYALAQRRQIERAARWLGLCGADGEGDDVFEVLEMPSLQAHRQARADWDSATSRRERGRIVACVLEAVPLDGTRTRRLLRAGTATQVFDVVYRVDSEQNIKRLPSVGPDPSDRPDGPTQIPP